MLADNRYCDQEFEDERVANALPGRDSVAIEIFGMEGVPEADLQAHIAEVEVHSEQQTKRTKVDMVVDQDALTRQLEEFRQKQQASQVMVHGGVSGGMMSHGMQAGMMPGMPPEIAHGMRPQQHNMVHHVPPNHRCNLYAIWEQCNATTVAPMAGMPQGMPMPGMPQGSMSNAPPNKLSDFSSAAPPSGALGQVTAPLQALAVSTGNMTFDGNTLADTTSAASISTLVTPSILSPAVASTQAPKKATDKLTRLVYVDTVSLEERRALLTKHRYDDTEGGH
ncbi:hypothetical protein BSLG_005827 [Batrachochytrium salamandrivorans]|nr:hypothetical protein BSLG_005827 [Batrachochytrium salamandrivorans]